MCIFLIVYIYVQYSDLYVMDMEEYVSAKQTTLATRRLISLSQIVVNLF